MGVAVMMSWWGALPSGPLLLQLHALMHAESVLLVDDGQAQIPEPDVLLEQGVGADDHGRLVPGDTRHQLGTLPALVPAGEPKGLQPQRTEPVAQVAQVLLRQQLRGRHEGDLAAGLHGLQAAKAATTVLPEPTSPCSRRSMGWGRCRSAAISSATRAGPRSARTASAPAALHAGCRPRQHGRPDALLAALRRRRLSW